MSVKAYLPIVNIFIRSYLFEGIDPLPDDCPKSWFFKEDEMTLMTTGPCDDSNKMYSWNFEDGKGLKYVPG